MTLNGAEFVENLVCKYPDLKPLYDEHFEYFGNILPHVLFGDFTRYFIDKGSDISRNRIFLEAFMSSMEAASACGEGHIENIVWVSFIENLTGEYDLMDRLTVVANIEFLQLIKEATGYNAARGVSAR